MFPDAAPAACATTVSPPTPTAPSLERGSFRPHPPENADFGRKRTPDAAAAGADTDVDTVSQVTQALGVATQVTDEQPAHGGPDSARVSEQRHERGGQPPRPPELSPTVRAGLALIDEARPPRKLGGRPAVIDDVAKIKIATLIGTGASLRQAAGFLGVSHSTVSAAIAADPQLRQEIECARQRAQLHPLACILRESGRNWKAAVWLMNYLNSLAGRDRTQEERNQKEAEASANLLIQSDMAIELRKEAQKAREQARRRREHQEYQSELAQERARKQAKQLARAPTSGAAAPAG